MRAGVIREALDQRMPVEDLLHDAALNSSAAAVDEPHLRIPGRMRLIDVFFNERRNVPGEEGVEVG